MLLLIGVRGVAGDVAYVVNIVDVDVVSRALFSLVSCCSMLSVFLIVLGFSVCLLPVDDLLVLFE